MNYKITNEDPYCDPNSYGTGSIITPRKGYNLRTRGEHNHLVRHDYRCPIHGVFESMVPSGDVPDEMPCPMNSWCVQMGNKEYASREDAEQAALSAGIDPETASYETQRCADTCTWQYPNVNQGISAGSVKT